MKNLWFSTPKGPNLEDTGSLLLVAPFFQFWPSLAAGWVNIGGYIQTCQQSSLGPGKVCSHMKNLLFATPERTNVEDSGFLQLVAPFSKFWPSLSAGWGNAMICQQSSLGPGKVYSHTKNLLFATPEGPNIRDYRLLLLVAPFSQIQPFLLLAGVLP